MKMSNLVSNFQVISNTSNLHFVTDTRILSNKLFSHWFGAKIKTNLFVGQFEREYFYLSHPEMTTLCAGN